MQFPWNMAWIGELSDHVERVTARLLDIPSEKMEEFEMEFAPFFYSE